MMGEAEWQECVQEWRNDLMFVEQGWEKKWWDGVAIVIEKEWRDD